MHSDTGSQRLHRMLPWRFVHCNTASAQVCDLRHCSSFGRCDISAISSYRTIPTLPLLIKLVHWYGHVCIFFLRYAQYVGVLCKLQACVHTSSIIHQLMRQHDDFQIVILYVCLFPSESGSQSDIMLNCWSDL